MSSLQRRILLTACFSHAVIHLYELATPALLLLIQREFGAGDYTMGRIVTLYGLCFGLGALPGGFLVDRYGSKPLLLLCLWGAAASVIGMALSPSLIWYVVAAGCMGLSISLYHPAGTALITHSIPLSGKIFAYHGMLGNLGVSGASLIAGALGALLGWRWAYALLALPGLFLGFRVLALPTPSVHDIRSRTGHGRWPHFISLLIGAAFLGVVYRGVTTFLPKFYSLTYTSETFGKTFLGGALATLTLLMGLVGMYVAGRLADRGTRREFLFLVGALVQIPFLLAMGYVLGPALIPMAMTVAFFHFLTQPAANQMVAEFTPPRLRGISFGLYFFTAFGAGSVGSSLSGWVSERWGLAATFPVMAAVLLPALAAGIFLSRLPLEKTRAITPIPVEGAEAG